MATTPGHIFLQRHPIERPVVSTEWRVAAPAAIVYWIAALVCVAAVYGASLGVPRMHWAFGDDSSIYIASAQSLAHGNGYRLIYYSEAPPAQVFPIGYPLLLSFIFRAFPLTGKTLLLIRALNAAFVLLWIEAARRLLTRALSAPLAACAAVAVALTPLAIKMSGQVKSDMLFAALAMLAMALAVAEAKPDVARRLLLRGMLLGAIAASAMVVRTIGFTLIIGLALEMLLRRRWTQLGGFAAAAAIVLFPWIIWSYLNHGGTFRSYATENVITWHTPISNFWALATRTAPLALFAPFETPTWHAMASHLHFAWVPAVLGCAIVAIVLVGWTSLLLRRDVVALVVGCYMSIVLLWWFEPSRFVIPILPLLVYCAAVGAKLAYSFAASLPIRRTALVGMVICIAGALFVDTVKIGRMWKYGDLDGAREASQWSQMHQGLDWIKDNTPKDSLVFTTFPAGVYLFTNRHTLDLNNSSHIGDVWTPSFTADLAARVQRIDPSRPIYLYATADRDTNVLSYISTHPGHTDLQWASQNGELFIYRLTRDQAEAGAGTP